MRPGALLQGEHTDPDVILAMREGIAKGEGFNVEVVNYRKDGNTFEVNVVCNPLLDERGQIDFMAIQNDITERKAAANQVEEYAAFQNLVVESVPDYLFVKDQEFRLVVANKKFVSLIR